MIRIFIMLIGLIIISALASGLADLPGRLRLIMAHYQVEVSLTLVAAMVLVTLLLVLVVWVLLRFLLSLPAQTSHQIRANQQRLGEASIARALLALTYGDTQTANQMAQRIGQKLPTSAIAFLLAAQAALMANQPQQAQTQYRALLDKSKKRADKTNYMLALEALFYLARRQHQRDQARALALQALETDPPAPSPPIWALAGLMALAIEAQDWQAAQNWFENWSHSGVSRKEIRQQRAFLLAAQTDAEAETET